MPRLSVRRDRLPIFQNVVYADRAAALAAPHGEFVLGTCTACGFSFNSAFDPARVVYDESYDNHVASGIFETYHRDLAAMLIERFEIVDGTVYDIGCGKGEFLRVLCALAPGIRGIGVDPSCDPVRDGNFELRREHFDASLFDGEARLVLLRHVLEHIAEPRQFLASLRAAMPGAPLYVEVPDLDWVLANRSFWDFCYEHCNYFTPPTLGAVLERAGFALVDQQGCFGDQYQWAIALPGEVVAPSVDAAAAERAVAAYWQFETAALDAWRARADRAGGIALWGMSTKGVLMSTLLGTARVHGGIDMNPGKQGRFAAGSGTAIHGPEWLRSLPAGTPVLAMNPNYLDEIKATAAAIRDDIEILTT